MGKNKSKKGSRKSQKSLRSLEFSKKELAAAREMKASLEKAEPKEKSAPWPIALAKKMLPSFISQWLKNSNLSLLSLLSLIAFRFGYTNKKMSKLFGIESDDLDKIKALLKNESTEQEIGVGTAVLKKIVSALKLDKRKTKSLIFNDMRSIVENSGNYPRSEYDPDDPEASSSAARNKEIDKEIDSLAKELTQKIMDALKKQ